MFNWIKSWFNKKPKETDTPTDIRMNFVFPDGRTFTIKDLNVHPETEKFSCKKHLDFFGNKPPTNNCNDCWEYYSQKCKKW